jgi:catechol 2,3-dioxygenase-like lactoylglutathione lyase family enzyme
VASRLDVRRYRTPREACGSHQNWTTQRSGRFFVAMTIKNALAGIAVTDLTMAIDWYTKVIGREPDQQPMPEVAEYGFSKGGWLQLFADKARAGKSSVTLTVDNLDARLNELRAAGIEASTPTRTDYVDTAIVTDPDGNRLVFAEAKSAANKAAS